jgi:hypothetical protein
MRRCIKDEFAHLPISRQRKYQLRMQRDQRCTECGEPAIEASRCLKHLIRARERQRRNRGLKRRYYGTLSYKLQSAAKSESTVRPAPRRVRINGPKRAKA